MKPRLVALLFPATLLTLLLATTASGQHRNRQENEALLGIVTAPASKGVEVVHVLADSPAERAGVRKGDRLLRIGRSKIETPIDVDDALRPFGAGLVVTLAIVRDGKKLHLDATLVGRSSYDGDFLKRRDRGSVGFEAPSWYGYAWHNIPRGQEPPTRENTQGKVVVIHAFQSW